MKIDKIIKIHFIKLDACIKTLKENNFYVHLVHKNHKETQVSWKNEKNCVLLARVSTCFPFYINFSFH